MENVELNNIISHYNGKILYNDLSIIDFSKNELIQIENLKEDLFQACFPNNIILDIGWYPSFDKRRFFSSLSYKRLQLGISNMHNKM